MCNYGSYVAASSEKKGIEKGLKEGVNGTIVLYIPEAYQKKGRKYAIMAIDKSGNVTILEDTDIYP